MCGQEGKLLACLGKKVTRWPLISPIHRIYSNAQIEWICRSLEISFGHCRLAKKVILTVFVLQTCTEKGTVLEEKGRLGMVSFLFRTRNHCDIFVKTLSSIRNSSLAFELWARFPEAPWESPLKMKKPCKTTSSKDLFPYPLDLKGQSCQAYLRPRVLILRAGGDE